LLYRWAEKGNFLWLVTEDILDEYKEVLKRRGVRPSLIGTVINLIRERAEEVGVRRFHRDAEPQRLPTRSPQGKSGVAESLCIVTSISDCGLACQGENQVVTCVAQMGVGFRCQCQPLSFAKTPALRKKSRRSEFSPTVHAGTFGRAPAGVSRADALTYTCVAALLGSVAIAVPWVPARRATRVDPMGASLLPAL
jgi:hypothetical protein